jgi:hypothetical protein
MTSPTQSHAGHPSHADARLEPEVRLARLAADVATRLRPVCSDLPAAEFDALVRDIARIKLRWATTD